MQPPQGLHDIPQLWLDVTRLLTRIGRGALTGIDRVEVAYLEAALGVSAKFICRTTRGYLVFGDDGATALLEMACEAHRPLGRADWFSRLTLRGHKPRHKVEAALRKYAIARCGPRGLPRLLESHGLDGITYVNVGHSNLSEMTLSAFAALSNSDVVVMIHDLIPLLHPDYVADGLPEKFAGRIARVRRYGDLVISNSAATDADLATHWIGQDAPARIVAHLGVTPQPLSDLDREDGYFVMLGTMEARKNHALMVDAWDVMAAQLPLAEVPKLHIIGNSGWKVDRLMARLQAHPLLGDRIFLHGPLPDEAVQDHLARACALLFPSIAEGFGYPPLEAAMAGAVPICSNLAVYKETLGDCAVYVDSGDAYSWAETIKQHIRGTAVTPDLTKLTVPTWPEHFETVQSAIALQRRKGRP